MSASPHHSPFSLWRRWRVKESLWTDISPRGGVLQRAPSPPFVSTGWELSLCTSPSLLWPQSTRIEMLMWHYEWEVRTVRPFVDGRPFGVSEMYPHSRVNAIPGCSHNQRSEIAQALAGFSSRSSFERQLDILLMPRKRTRLYNDSDHSGSQDKPHVS